MLEMRGGGCRQRIVGSDGSLRNASRAEEGVRRRSHAEDVGLKYSEHRKMALKVVVGEEGKCGKRGYCASGSIRWQISVSVRHYDQNRLGEGDREGERGLRGEGWRSSRLSGLRALS